MTNAELRLEIAKALVKGLHYPPIESERVLCLLNQIEDMRKALEFYAEKSNYIGHSPTVYENTLAGYQAIRVRGGVFDDDGKRARQTLARYKE